MRTAEITLGINQPAAIVYNFVVDPDHIASWVANEDSQITVDAGPLQIGSTFTVQRGDDDSERRRLIYEVVALEPESEVALRTAGRLMTYTTRRKFSEQDGKTLVTELIEMEDPPGLAKLLTGFMLGRDKKLHQKNLQRLKTALK